MLRPLFLALLGMAGCLEYGLTADSEAGLEPDEAADPHVDPKGDVDREDEPPPPRTCEDAIIDTVVLMAPEARGCPWGRNDNLERRNEFNQARTIESWELPLPAGAMLCEVSLSTQEERVVFDDHISLLLDDALLVGGGSGYPVDLLEEVDGVPRFDWMRVRGTAFQGRDTPYWCLGGAEPCVVPDTERPGRLELAFDDALLRDLVVASDAPELSLLTFGDDNESDCSHSAITLEVTLAWLP